MEIWQILVISEILVYIQANCILVTCNYWMNIKRANVHYYSVNGLASILKETKPRCSSLLSSSFSQQSSPCLPAMVSSVATGTAVLGVPEHRGRHTLRVLLGWEDNKGMMRITLLRVRKLDLVPSFDLLFHLLNFSSISCSGMYWVHSH